MTAHENDWPPNDANFTWFVTWGEGALFLSHDPPKPKTLAHRLRSRALYWRWRIEDAIEDGRFWLAIRLHRLADRISSGAY